MTDVKFKIHLQINGKPYSFFTEREFTDEEMKSSHPQRTFEDICVAVIRYMQEKDLEAKLKSISSQFT